MMFRIDFFIGFMCFSLVLGKVFVLFFIYYYVFIIYSCVIVELIVGIDIELYIKIDLRFMEGCYKVYKYVVVRIEFKFIV